MKKIKIFSSRDHSELESSVNEFIKNKDLIDIKIQDHRDGHMICGYCVAVIVYRECQPNDAFDYQTGLKL